MSERSYDILHEPVAFGSRTLRNRIAMAPMTRKRSPDGVPPREVADYYERRGHGGVGLIFSEGTFIDHPSAQAHEGKAYANIPYFFGARALDGWRDVVKRLHSTGAGFVPQLWHVGEVRRLGMPTDPGVPGLGPRRIIQDGRVVVEAMTARDLDAVADSYARGARSARDLGCDGVAVHGAHGYLLDQFFWRETNSRTDAFGGTMENRCRPAVTVIRAMRKACGADFPIVFRFSQWKMTDYHARIAKTPQELETLLGLLVEAGVDWFDVSTRRFWEPAFEGDGKSLAAWTKHFSGKPVIAVGSIGLDQPHHSKFFRDTATIDANVTDLVEVVAALERGDFDVAAVGRALLADPEWAHKVHAGRMADIRPFVRADLETYR